jgi:hypothetical protein
MLWAAECNRWRSSRRRDEQIKLGKAVAGSRVDLAKSGTGLAVKKGAAKPDIGSVDALKKTLLSVKSHGLEPAW